MKPNPVLLLLIVFGAGCMAPSPTQVDSMHRQSGSMLPEEGPPLIRSIYSDSLHLEEPPAMSPQPPNGRTPTNTTISGVGQRWIFRVPHAVNAGNATLALWVDVQGSVVSPGGLPDAPSCTWNVGLTFVDEQGQTTGNGMGCANEPPGPLPTGVSKVDIAIAYNGAPGPLHEGSQVQLVVYTSGLTTAPAGAVYLMSGSLVHDSALTIPGLHLSVDES
jgi:hypothetical protein